MDTKKVLRRLRKKTLVNPETGCWEWTRVYRGDNGYGKIAIDKQSYYVHRLSAILFLGYRPETGLNVLHRCNNRRCWNHEHLYVGTHEDNMQDKSKSITRCPNGHEYVGQNVYEYQKLDGRRQRMCKQCRIERTREWRKMKPKMKEAG